MTNLSMLIEHSLIWWKLFIIQTLQLFNRLDLPMEDATIIDNRTVLILRGSAATKISVNSQHVCIRVAPQDYDRITDLKNIADTLKLQLFVKPRTQLSGCVDWKHDRIEMVPLYTRNGVFHIYKISDIL